MTRALLLAAMALVSIVLLTADAIDRQRVFRVVVRLDVGMFEEQAEDEGEDAPAGADRAWWRV